METDFTNETSRNSRKKAGFFKRLLPPRDIIVRREDSVSYYTVSTRAQVLCVAVLLALGAWTVFSSRFYVRYEHVISVKDRQSARVRQAYAGLLEEVAAYRDHIGDVASEMDRNHFALLKVHEERLKINDGEDSLPSAVRKVEPFTAPENSVFEREENRLSRERERLKNEIMSVQGRLAALAEKGTARKIRPEPLEVSFRKALLQRDLAVSEAEELKNRMRGLEDMVAEMQDTQILVFQKMASLADGNIDVIEQGLSGIKQTLADTGLGMNTLLNRIRRDKETAGIGGPFIPAPISKMRHPNLNISLVSLNQRLDHWYDLTTLQNAMPLGRPLDRIRVTSPFGAREDPFQGAPARHEAVDLGGITGEPVYTTAPGKVVRAGRWGWYGNMVEIDHGMGFRTRYAHMDKVFVTKGDTVRSGDRIGSVGSTGRSTGSHLHYEIRVRGYAVDPMKFIKAGKNVFKG